MSEPDVEPLAPQESLSGFTDSNGSWVTATEFEEKCGDELDAPVREVWDALAEKDVLRVRRNDDGEPVTAQLTQFAVDLFELPEDARIDEQVAVYVDHGKEPPEELREAYLERVSEHPGSDDRVLGGERHV